VIAGDLTRLACDASLIPTDDDFRISASFAPALGVGADARLRGLSWNGSRVLRHAGKEPAAKRWLANVGALGEKASRYAAVIEPFVAEASAEIRPQLDNRPPLLALNVLGTGEGGMEAEKGAIHRALFPALYDAAARHHADLVLVCWGRRAYSAAQRVRRGHLQDTYGGDHSFLWDLGPRSKDLVLAARRLAEDARRRNLVLFLGAGVSAGAGLPAWQGLLDGIALDVGVDETDLSRLHRLDLRDQAAVLQRRLGPDRALQKIVTPHLEHTSYALTHGLLASLPTREAVTTNYDQLFEAAVKPVDGPIAVLPYQPVQHGKRWLLKLHGSLDRDDSIILTRSDYLGAPAQHGALFGLVQAMLLTRHMLFVGYSLSDEDFHQLVHGVRLALAGAEHPARFGTVLALFNDPLFTELWSGDVEVVAVADEPKSEPSAADVAQAARRLQILLDLIAFEAADLDSFLLDPTYAGLLSPAERKLAKRLRVLSESPVVATPDDDLPAGARVRQFLRDLGAPDLPPQDD
jgi:hypothetical protein